MDHPNGNARKKTAEFEPVEFERGKWKSFETYATDFLTNTAALPLAAVGVYSRMRASIWAYGNGWSLTATLLAWLTHSGARDSTELDAAIEVLEQRGIAIFERDGLNLTVIEPYMHADLRRKEKRRTQKVRSRKTSRETGHATSVGTSHATSHATSHETSHETSRETSVLPPSSVPLPPTSTSPATATKAKTASPIGDARPAGAGPAGTDSGHLPPNARPGRSPLRIDSAEVEAVIAHYVSYHPKAFPGDRERRLICARRKEGYSPADLCEAIDGCHRSPFHCGVNERGTKYQSLELIVRDSTRVAQFIEIARAPPATGPITHRQSAEDAAEARLLARAGLPPKERANHERT